MPGQYSSLLDGASPACVPERSRTGGPWEENQDERRRRSDSTFDFKQRQSHAPQRGSCDCQERIRQVVVFTGIVILLRTNTCTHLADYTVSHTDLAQNPFLL